MIATGGAIEPNSASAAPKIIVGRIANEMSAFDGKAVNEKSPNETAMMGTIGTRVAAAMIMDSRQL